MSFSPAEFSGEPRPSDAELLQATARGSEEAFADLVDRYQTLVRTTIYRLGWRDSEAEDLAQEVFLRVWKAAGRYQPTAKFSTWLLTITRHVVFSEGRRRQKMRCVSLEAEQVAPEVAALCSRSEEEPQARVQEAELRAAVEKALASLPPQQALAFTLHRYEGLSHEEVAEVLGGTVSSVKSLIFRARETLRHRLRQYAPKTRPQ